MWYKTDARSSVIAADDNTNNAAGPVRYDPFGTPTGAAYMTTGYRSELHLGSLIHLRNRDYDPAVGQFTTRDELDGVDGTPTVANPYHYVDNDPHNGTDPLGLQRLNDDGFPDGRGPACLNEPQLDVWVGTPESIGPLAVPSWIPRVEIGVGLSSQLPARARLALFALCLQTRSRSPIADSVAAATAFMELAVVPDRLDIGCARDPEGIAVACIPFSAGLSPGLLVNKNAEAYTQGHFIFCWSTCEGPLLEHERVHVDQWSKYGDRFAQLYLSSYGGDWDNACASVYEREAYEKNYPCPHD